MLNLNNIFNFLVSTWRQFVSSFFEKPGLQLFFIMFAFILIGFLGIELLFLLLKRIRSPELRSKIFIILGVIITNLACFYFANYNKESHPGSTDFISFIFFNLIFLSIYFYSVYSKR